MNKVNVAFGDLSSRGLGRLNYAVREVDWLTPEDLPATDLANLFTRIENALSNARGLTIQFVNATSGCGSEQIAYDMAWVGASALGRTVLVLNGARSPDGAVSDSKGGASGREGQTDPSAALPQRTLLEDCMIKTRGHGMYMANLCDAFGGQRPLGAIEEVAKNLRDLSGYFDMIVVVAPPADRDPFCSAFAKHVDGNVLVLEAERTRRAAAVDLHEMLASSGRPILGAVLNNKRNYVPRWLGLES